VIKNYLIQLYAIDPTYATAVYEGLPTKPDSFTLEEVAAKAPEAHLVGVEPQFQLENIGSEFMGMGVGPKSRTFRFFFVSFKTSTDLPFVEQSTALGRAPSRRPPSKRIRVS
jgi:hypothetical protein